MVVVSKKLQYPFQWSLHLDVHIAWQKVWSSHPCLLAMAHLWSSYLSMTPKLFYRKPPHYLTFGVKILQKIWSILQCAFHVYIWCFKIISDDLVLVNEIPSNQNRLIYLPCNLGTPLISIVIMIQIWLLHGDIQLKGVKSKDNRIY